MCRLLFFDIEILITSLVSFGHCVVSCSSIYRFWLPLWYLLAIVLSVLLRYTDSDYPFGIFWPLCCQFFFDIQILITPLVSFGHRVVSSSSIYWFWLPLWYLLAIVLSVLLRYTDSDYLFGIFWPLCCQFLFDIGIRITPLVSVGHCVVSSSSIYGFRLHLWYLLAIVSSALLWYTDSDYPFGIFWPLCRLLFFDIRILITPLVYFDHCVVSSSSIYGFWLSLWYLLAIVLSVLLRYRDSDLPLWYLLAIVLSVLLRYRDSDLTHWFLLAIVLSVLLRYTDSDYLIGFFGHCVLCSSLIYGFWLPLWYLLAIVSSAFLWYTYSDYRFGIFWPLLRLLFFDIQILITALVSFGHCVVCFSSIYRFWLPLWLLVAIVSSILLRYTDSDYPLVSFGHCVVCSSSIYRFWLPIWYLVAIVSSSLIRYTDSDYPFGILWPLYCQFFFDIQILITPLVSFGHRVVSSSSIYRFWLPLWYLLAIVLSVLIRYRDSEYSFGICWPLCCQFFFDIRIQITPLVSCGHCVVFSYSI